MSGRRPGRRAVGASVALHALLLLFMVSGLARTEPPEFRVYRVRIYSPPPAPVVETAPERPVTTPPPVEARRPEPRERPEPQPEEPEPQPEEVERPPPKPAQAEQPDRPTSPEGQPGGEDLDVDIAGEEFPYPDYLENVIRQVHRYFRWTGTSRPVATVYFVIRRDGSVDDLRVVRSSGNLQFDFEAQGAVEQAGRRGEFGPLPEGFGRDALPVMLDIEPPR